MAFALATALAERNPEMTIVLSPVTTFPVEIENFPSNVWLNPLSSIGQSDLEDAICIVTFNLSRVYPERFNRRNVYLWSHNLWDCCESFLRHYNNLGGLVVVSEIQLAIAGVASNLHRVAMIQNPIDLSRIPFFPETDSPRPEFVVLGTKGFDEFVRIWLGSCGPSKHDAKLHVIGGPNLYHQSAREQHEQFLTQCDKLRRSGLFDIEIHGVLGEQKWDVLRRCSYGIVNPSGRTECFPTSIVELMGAGCVVVTVPRWGNGELVSESNEYFCPSRGSLTRTLRGLLAGSPTPPSSRANVRHYIERRISPPRKVADSWHEVMKGNYTMPLSQRWSVATLLRREPAALGRIALYLANIKTR